MKKARKRETCDYWTEFWDDSEYRWVCVNVKRGLVDNVESIAEDASKPISYVFAIDSGIL